MRYELSFLHLAPNQSEILPTGGQDFPVSAYLGNLENYVTHEVPWHWHREIEVLIVIKGTALVYLGEECVSLSVGQGLFCNSNVLHRIVSEGTEKCIFHSIVLDPSIVGGNADSIFSQKYVFPLTQAHNLPFVMFTGEYPWHKVCLSAIEAAHDACTEEFDGYEFTIREEMSTLWFLIMKHCHDEVFSADHSSSVDTRRTRRILKYIHAHYQDPITLQDLADTVNICPRECQRCFKKVLHMTPTAYILQYRLELAMDMLSSTDLSVMEICVSTGFNSPSYFSKMFRRHFGKSPNEFRQRKNLESH
jgi:AraC-like DNA-binding protein/mannose-6-phosphate isomerase-like protein (cupin superfamily)